MEHQVHTDRNETQNKRIQKVQRGQIQIIAGWRLIL